MMLGRRDIAALCTIALVAVLGSAVSDVVLESELEQIRGTRVALEARRALERRGLPSGVAGELTIVRETESTKYRFLNKRVYLVHTGEAAREGTALLGDRVEDKARADRHSEARRKRSIRERLEGGAWRATVAEGPLTAELTADPPLVPRPSPWAGGLLAVAAGALLFLGVRAQRSTRVAAILGLGVASAILFVFASRALDSSSARAAAYLAEGLTAGPGVVLPKAGLFGGLAAVVVLGLGFALFAFGPRGEAFARSLARDRGAYVAIAPAMLGLLLLIGIPFAVGVGLSFFEHRHGTFTFVGLDNFVRILAPRDRPLFAPGSLLYALFVNVVWTVSNVSLHVGIGLALAIALEKRAARLARVYRFFLIIPWAVPAYLTALIWKSMFDPDVGAVNRLLGLEGMSWMHTPVTAFLANLITNVWLGFPFMMVVCLGALTSIPKELYEAAEVDGASSRQQFFSITLPLLKPALLPAVILGSIWTFNRFEVIYLVSEGRPDGATDILVTEAYRWAFERGLAQGGAYGYAAAYSVVIFLVLLVYGWMTSRVAKAAEEALR